MPKPQLLTVLANANDQIAQSLLQLHARAKAEEDERRRTNLAEFAAAAKPASGGAAFDERMDIDRDLADLGDAQLRGEVLAFRAELGDRADEAAAFTASLGLPELRAELSLLRVEFPHIAARRAERARHKTRSKWRTAIPVFPDLAPASEPAPPPPLTKHGLPYRDWKRRRLQWKLLWIATAVVLVAFAALLLSLQTSVGPAAQATLRLTANITIILAASILLVCLVTLTAMALVRSWRALGRAIYDPITAIAPPDPTTDQPLGALAGLALRAARGLHSAHRLQLGLSIAGAMAIAAALVGALVMATTRRTSYAALFGGGGLCASVLAMRWQPFDRAGYARDLAAQADILATGLALRILAISQITDPVERRQVEWAAVKDYTESAVKLRRLDVHVSTHDVTKQVAASA